MSHKIADSEIDMSTCLMAEKFLSVRVCMKDFHFYYCLFYDFTQPYETKTAFFVMPRMLRQFLLKKEHY